MAETIAAQPWPEANPELILDEHVTIAVQVNGKLRATLQLAKDTDKEEVERTALNQEAVKAAIDGKAVRKIIVVPNRIVNVVAA